MNIYSQQPLNLISNMMKKRRKESINQVLTYKASSMQRIIQVMQTVAQQSCIRACQLFCLPVDSLLCDNFTCCSAQTLKPHEEKNIAETLRNPPSTIMIVNISNSTLIDCVIGDSNTAASTERAPLLQEPGLQKHAQVSCSCCCNKEEEAQTAPPPLPSGEQLNISIHGSRLNYVIIGDNNYVHAEHNQPFD